MHLSSRKQHSSSEQQQQEAARAPSLLSSFEKNNVDQRKYTIPAQLGLTCTMPNKLGNRPLCSAFQTPGSCDRTGRHPVAQHHQARPGQPKHTHDGRWSSPVTNGHKTTERLGARNTPAHEFNGEQNARRDAFPQNYIKIESTHSAPYYAQLSPCDEKT